MDLVEFLKVFAMLNIQKMEKLSITILRIVVIMMEKLLLQLLHIKLQNQMDMQLKLIYQKLP